MTEKTREVKGERTPARETYTTSNQHDNDACANARLAGFSTPEEHDAATLTNEGKLSCVLDTDGQFYGLGEGNAPRAIVAAHFYNSDMELIQAFQLVGPAGAFACADFRNGKLERFDCSPAKLEESKQWLAKLIATNKA